MLPRSHTILRIAKRRAIRQDNFMFRRLLLIPKWRLIVYAATLPLVFGGYFFWSPGADVRDGRNNRGKNGIWLQHGWIGDDFWFDTNSRDRSKFRSAERIEKLTAKLSEHQIRYVFPHLAPAQLDGRLAGNDAVQTELFLDACSAADIQVMPWIGGVFDFHCQLNDPEWRETFAASIGDLMERHPRLAGVHLNIEPLRNGNADFLLLLEQVRAALPKDKKISIAGYPPPTIWHRFPDVHWDEDYYREVASRADQMAVMMYDTALPFEKLYVNLMSAWTQQLLAWTPDDCEVLFGVPAYDDEDVDYHDPSVENLKNGLLGVHGGLARFDALPTNYGGVAIYCEWEMDDSEWELFAERF